MGINNLWEVLEPAATTVPIVSLAVLDRYWVSMQADGLNNVSKEDGTRPDVKRGHRVSTKDHWMVQPTQRILNAFNMQWITAAGEAGAQLALMKNAVVIDAVMIDYSDAFLFGAQTVLRNSSFSADATATVKMYITSSIQERVETHFTIDGFMTMAVYCAGYYKNNGLSGCGRESALGLVHCMNTSVLRDAGCGSNSPYKTLERWRMDALYHLMDGPTGEMGRAHPAVARELPDPFPNEHILNLYAKHAVTPLMELPILHSPAPPDIAPLALLV
ncbi:hypothetical protein EV424DRAFT_1541331 [Suillus variegatus]|nr:hypothetical protein EV424DRAFT_1541331 [Suillus variegatus]